MTNEDFYFGSSVRIAATLKHISECCNKTLCEECIIQEACCQPPIKFVEWLQEEWQGGQA